ncbi:hypothetical protein ABIC32_002420 [Brevundimonas sp. 1080]|uniref:hypothetical protein n=1 Tax=Brevundimonas sp. 1080 TaxID=3156405 RepID=UPI003396F5FA
MKMKTLSATAIMVAFCGCAKAPHEASLSGPDCAPWKSKAVVQCWWPGTGHPLDQCQLTSPSSCPFDAKAVDALSGDVSVTLDHAKYPAGTWAWFDVYQDETGQVGRASFKEDVGTILPKHIKPVID